MFGNISKGITFIGEKGGPLQFFDYSQLRTSKFALAYENEHDI